MNANTKNIVFDWNGTLLDDFDALHGCTNTILAAEGHPPVHADHFRHHYNIPFERFYHGMGMPQEQIDRLMSLENTAFHDHYEPLASKAPLRDGAVDVLSHARRHGVKSLILSNHLVDPIRVQLKRLDVEHMFEEVLAYVDRATQFRDMTKGERLKRFMNARAMTPRHTIIIGDSVEEVEIAKEQGLISVAITGGCVSEQRLSAAKPDYIIHSLHELKPIMLERGFVMGIAS